jgi:hypothetical protein
MKYSKRKRRSKVAVCRCRSVGEVETRPVGVTSPVAKQKNPNDVKG